MNIQLKSPEDKSEALWESKWKYERFPRIAPGVVHDGWGSTGEPSSSQRSGIFTEAMGPWFKEGVKILDYGCGAARYCNFLSGHLKDFQYYGVDMPGGGPYSIYQDVPSMSEKGIQLAREAYGHDPRIHLGFIGSPLEQEALNSVDVVLLASIFTHLTADQFISVNNKFLPVISRGGIVVFSIFIADEYKALGGGSYGFEDTYSIVYSTLEQITSYCQQNSISCHESYPWSVTSSLWARIFRFEQEA